MTATCHTRHGVEQTGRPRRDVELKKTVAFSVAAVSTVTPNKGAASVAAKQ